MKKLLLSAAIMAGAGLSAQTVYKCYESDNGDALGIMAKSVNGTIVSVKYRGKKQAIPVRYAEQQTEDADLKELYLERYNGKITGRYTFINTPNNETLQYERTKDGKFYYFTLDAGATYRNGAYRKTPCW